MTKEKTTKKPITQKKTSVVGTLRSLSVGESVLFQTASTKASTIRSTITRFQSKNEERFSASEKGLKNLVIVTRTK